MPSCGGKTSKMAEKQGQRKGKKKKEEKSRRGK
jgi:hypothetical protein